MKMYKAHKTKLPRKNICTLTARGLREASIIIIIIIMEIYKTPTLRLKAPNKHTHIIYIEMENVINKKKAKLSTRVFKHYARYTYTHTHTHTLTHIHTHTHTHTHTYGHIHTQARKHTLRYARTH